MSVFTVIETINLSRAKIETSANKISPVAKKVPGVFNTVVNYMSFN